MSGDEAPPDEVQTGPPVTWNVAQSPKSDVIDDAKDDNAVPPDLGGEFVSKSGDAFNFGDDKADDQFGAFAWNQNDEEMKQDLNSAVTNMFGSGQESLHNAFAEFSFLDDMSNTRNEDQSLDELAEVQAKLASLKSREGKLTKHMRHQSRIIEGVPEDEEANFGAGDGDMEVMPPVMGSATKPGHNRRKSLLATAEDIEAAGRDFEDDVSEMMNERELKMWLRKEDTSHPAARAIQTLKDKFEELHGRFMKLSNKYIALERRKKDLDLECQTLRDLKSKYGKMVVENEVEVEIEKQKAMLTRKQWRVGSVMEVYSFSAEEWYKGTIVKVDFEPEENVELLEVEYMDANNKRKRKHVERFDMETVREWFESDLDKQKDVHNRVQDMMKSENQRLKERLQAQRDAGEKEKRSLREQRTKLQSMMSSGSEESRELRRLLDDMDTTNERMRDQNENLTIQNAKLLKSVKVSEKKAQEMGKINDRMKDKMQSGGESKQLKQRIKAYKNEADELEEEAQSLRVQNTDIREKYDEMLEKYERLEEENNKNKNVQNSNLEKKKSHLRQLSQTAGKMAADQSKKKYEAKIKQLEMQVSHWETAFHQKPAGGVDPGVILEKVEQARKEMDDQLNHVIDSKFRLLRNTNMEIEKMRDDLRKMSGGQSIGVLQRYSRPGSDYRQRANTYGAPGGRGPQRGPSMLDRYMSQVREQQQGQMGMGAQAPMGPMGMPAGPGMAGNMTHLQENKTQVINYYMNNPQLQKSNSFLT